MDYTQFHQISIYSFIFHFYFVSFYFIIFYLFNLFSESLENTYYGH